MQGFNGFPDGQLKTIALPALFFSELLPIIDDLAELRVTLYAFWALHQKEGTIRYLCRHDLASDDLLMESLGQPRRAAEAVLDDALEHAVARGTLLHISVEGSAGTENLYFMNTERGRAAVDGIIRGEWRPTGDPEEPVSLIVERPNIFVLYEQNIGPLTPLLAEELMEAEDTYPESWIEGAVREAVELNKRSWRYVQRILERWATEGKDDETSRRGDERDRRRYLEGEWADIIEH